MSMHIETTDLVAVDGGHRRKGYQVVENGEPVSRLFHTRLEALAWMQANARQR